MYFLIITISSCLSHTRVSYTGGEGVLSGLRQSEGCSALRNVHGLINLGAWVAQALLVHALLVYGLHALLDSLNSFVTKLVSAQGHAEVVRGD